MCAMEAGKRGRRVALIERADRAGKKILISGGGRCNFTNIYCQPEHFLSANPHFAKSALARYAPADFIALVEKHHILYHEKTRGQLFCDHSANDIVNMLEAECRAAGVQVFLKSKVREVQRTTEFVVRTESTEFRAPALVVATGGLSIPKIGATAFGYDLARQFGLQIRQTRPALVPLILGRKDRTQYCDLAGVSAEVDVSTDQHSFREKLLITHRGLSGPAILQISSYWQPGEELRLDLLPGSDPLATLKQLQAQRPAAELRTLLGELLPKRFAQRFCEVWLPAGVHNRPIRQYNAPQLRAIADALQEWPLVASGTEGYRTAEVTLGGVDTDELSSSTMQSRRVPGLYFIGEVVDVTGWLGGYNFQWAWSSGHAAGMAA